jgi:hypothetical protein
VLDESIPNPSRVCQRAVHKRLDGYCGQVCLPRCAGADTRDDRFLCYFFATTPGRFEVSGTRLNTGDSCKSKRYLEDKRHTNAHQPVTSSLTNWGYNPPFSPLNQSD